MADESTGIEYLIDEDLGDNGGVLRVRKIEKLEAWVQQERDFWQWLNDSAVSGVAPCKIFKLTSRRRSTPRTGLGLHPWRTGTLDPN